MEEGGPAGEGEERAQQVYDDASDEQTRESAIRTCLRAVRPDLITTFMGFATVVITRTDIIGGLFEM